MGIRFFCPKNKDVDIEKIKRPAAMIGVSALALLVLPAIVKFTSFFIVGIVATCLLLAVLAFAKPMTFLSGAKSLAQRALS